MSPSHQCRREEKAKNSEFHANNTGKENEDSEELNLLPSPSKASGAGVIVVTSTSETPSSVKRKRDISQSNETLEQAGNDKSSDASKDHDVTFLDNEKLPQQQQLPVAKKAKSNNSTKKQTTQTQRQCAGCNETKAQDEFTNSQLNKGAAAKCRKCVLERKDSSRICGQCLKNKAVEEFSKQQRKKIGTDAKCKDCVAQGPPRTDESLTLTCQQCQESKHIDEFGKQQRKKGADAKCKLCITRGALKECVTCHAMKNRIEYRKGKKSCKECEERLDQMPKQCEICQQAQPKDAFSYKQWNSEDGPKCLKCITTLTEYHNREIKCRQCKKSKHIQNFGKRQRNKGAEAKCSECFRTDNFVKCVKCRIYKEPGRYKYDGKIRNDSCFECYESVPRRCESCQEEKDKSAFSCLMWKGKQSYLWNDRFIQTGSKIRKCLECFSEEEEDEMMQQEEQARERKEREILERSLISDAQGLKRKGSVLYKRPDLLDMAFKEPLDANDLIGEYDIVYHGGIYWRDPFISMRQRTYKDTTMTLKKSDDNFLLGCMKVEVDSEFFNKDMHFTSMVKISDIRSDDNTSVRFKVTDSPFADSDETMGEEDENAFGRIRMVDKRIACPWIGRESMFPLESVSDEVCRTLESEVKKPTDYSKSWLCNHLFFDALIAKRIHEFGSSKPSPFFFIEKGDLLVHAQWKRDDQNSFFFARRRVCA